MLPCRDSTCRVEPVGYGWIVLRSVAPGLRSCPACQIWVKPCEFEAVFHCGRCQGTRWRSTAHASCRSYVWLQKERSLLQHCGVLEKLVDRPFGALVPCGEHVSVWWVSTNRAAQSQSPHIPRRMNDRIDFSHVSVRYARSPHVACGLRDLTIPNKV